MSEASGDVLQIDQEAGLPAPARGVVRRFLHTPSALMGLVLFMMVIAMALVEPLLPGEAYAPGNPLVGGPSRAHPFGTDNFQRDMLQLTFAGVRITMTVVISVVTMSAVIGVSLGLIAGVVGGLVDDGLTRMLELVQSVPRFFLAYLIIGLYGPGLTKMILILGLTSWTLLARVVRAETLSMRSRPFVEAARAAGASTRSVVVRHLLPNVLPQALVITVLMGSRVILIEAGLAYLGLGDPQKPSLGTLARNAQEYLRESWSMAFFPGLAIVLCVLSMNLLSDSLGLALHPGSTHSYPSLSSGPRRAARWWARPAGRLWPERRRPGRPR